jgi:hypothetical protein
VQWSSTQFSRALCCLELGRNEQAGQILRQVLQLDPETEFRTGIAFYALVTTGERISIQPPSDSIPVWGGMFAPDVPPTEPSTEAASPAAGNSP